MALTKVTNDLQDALAAAQPTITSVGTLTNFTSTGIDDNATSNAITITSDENVGIGGAPSHPLHITKEIAGYQAYFNNDNGSGQGVKVRVKANDSGNFNMLELVSASTGSDVTAMVVRDDGNVAASGDVIVGSLARSAFTFVDSHPLLVGPNSNTNAGASFRNANGAEAFIQQNANNTAYMGTVTNHPLSIRTSNTDRLKIDASGRVTMPSQPSFHAQRSADYSGYNPAGNYGMPILYNVAIYNTGNHFSTSTGTFTAPVAGIYIFRAECYTTGSVWGQSWFSLNGARAVATDQSFAPSVFATGSAIMKLAVGDYVGFHPYNSGTSQTITANPNHTWFKGHLIG
jgi:hypothetical protein